MSLVLSATRRLPFLDVGGLVALVWRLLEGVAAESAMGCLWVEQLGEPVVLTPETLVTAVERGGYIAAGPGAPTHIVELYTLPAEVGRAGRAHLNIARNLQGPSPHPGLWLKLELGSPPFEDDADRLVALLQRMASAAPLDAASIGPRYGGQGRALGWARLVRRVAREELPAGARVIPVGSSFVVVAHDEVPASTSEAALTAMARVTAATDETHAASPTPVEESAVPAASILPKPASAPGGDLDGTHEISLTNVSRPVTPFGEAVQGDRSVPVEMSSRAQQLRTGTEDINVAEIRSIVLPFGGAPSAQIAPSLTLEQYAELRGMLVRVGEAHQATWARFGVTSTDAKRMLQEQFAARFRNDPAAQAHFLELLKTFASESSTESADAGGDDMDLDATAELRDARVERPSLPFAEHRPDSSAATSSGPPPPERKPK